MCLICICRLEIRFDFYIGEKADAIYIMVSDPIAMKKDRIHIYRLLANELLKNIKNGDQETTKANNINIVKPITYENIDTIKQIKNIDIYRI